MALRLWRHSSELITTGATRKCRDSTCNSGFAAGAIVGLILWTPVLPWLFKWAGRIDTSA